MQLEIQVALNFVISFMYNKMPRRRVNIFAEELERALRFRFQSHWYPDRPCRGSAYRCLRTGDPLDPVLDAAARESGLALAEIRQTLPEDLSVWIDPGEVSYRIGEKGTVKLLYSEPAGGAERATEERCDREVTSTFNPEAQCFRPIDALSASLGSLAMASPPTGSPFGAPAAASPAPFKSASPAPFAPQRPRAPVTFTTAAFAQTKFGSTKLKSSGKRGSRMSPTEFSNYIKQRALLQQPALLTPFPQQARPLSPAAPPPPSPQQQQQQQQQQVEPFFASKMAGAPPGMLEVAEVFAAPPPPPPRAPPGGAMLAALTPESQQLLESLTYASNPHLQHLLVAN